MSEKIYARVVDGKVAEYPVFELHINNRAHPLNWYTQVVFDAKPEVPEFYTLKEELTVKSGQVFASYSLQPESLDVVLNKVQQYAGPNPNGGEPEPVQFEQIPQQTVQRVIELAREMVQKRLDAFAAQKNYDGILSACSYATSQNSVFAAEGQQAVNARDASWLALYNYLGQVQAGATPVPKVPADIEAVLPALSWA